MNLSRRAWLGLAAGSAGAILLGQEHRKRGWDALDDRPIRPGRKPKNIIFCVVDGMPLSALTMVDQLRELQEGRSSYWSWLLDQPVVVNGLQATRSLNSVVTDSSAAASAWGCGVPIWNGMTNMLPDKTELRTLTELMSGKGVRCGLVTTATITHATPSGFAVPCINRDLEGVIAERYLKSGCDILFGGGARFFLSETRPDKRDLVGEFRNAGFKILRNRNDLLASKDRKALGLFSNSHLPYTVDHRESAAMRESVPTLAEMATVAIENLKSSRNGFLLQIEGARVDHGAHSNDLAAMYYDQIAFEDAVKVAIDFAMRDGETLVIITADHACGGLALNGAGDEYIDSNEGLKTVLNMKSSYGPLLTAIGPSPTAGRVAEVMADRLGLKITAEEAEAIAGSIKGSHPFKLSQFFRSVNGTLGMVIGNYSKFTFTSGNHHADHVLVTAYGPGAERCAGLTRNTDFFHLMLDMKGMKYQNPSMDFATALPLYEKLQKELNPELLAHYGAPSCECGRDH